MARRKKVLTPREEVAKSDYLKDLLREATRARRSQRFAPLGGMGLSDSTRRLLFDAGYVEHHVEFWSREYAAGRTTERPAVTDGLVATAEGARASDAFDAENTPRKA